MVFANLVIINTWAGWPIVTIAFDIWHTLHEIHRYLIFETWNHSAVPVLRVGGNVYTLHNIITLCSNYASNIIITKYIIKSRSCIK